MEVECKNLNGKMLGRISVGIGRSAHYSRCITLRMSSRTSSVSGDQDSKSKQLKEPSKAEHPGMCCVLDAH